MSLAVLRELVARLRRRPSGDSMCWRPEAGDESTRVVQTEAGPGPGTPLPVSQAHGVRQNPQLNSRNTTMAQPDTGCANPDHQAVGHLDHPAGTTR
ncbi:hypothetical protein QBC98_006947 [Kitasatospora acidiphila]